MNAFERGLFMRKLAISLALATTALATPALARDHSFYAGLEGGVMVIEDAGFDLRNANNATVAKDLMVLDFKPGWDVDAVAGYDFGMVRLEGEIGYKRASLDEVELRDIPDTGLGFGSHLDASGHARSLSFMINGMLDLGDEDSWSGYVGPGIGIADVRYSVGGTDPVVDTTFVDSEVSESRLAWQIVAGVRTALTPTLDLGLKYRFFNVPNLKSDNTPDDFKTRWRSHSLLLSLIYNFAPPPPPPPPPQPPPPPPPPPPATQTCPDGTVILATEVCPAPPPPPPPPPPAPERG